MRPSTEGKVRLWVTSRRNRLGESLRKKVLRMRPISRMMMQNVRANQKSSTGRNVEIANPVREGGLAAKDPSGRVLSERFRYDHLRIGKTRQIVCGGKAAFQHKLQFRVQFFFDGWVGGKGVPDPGERLCGGFMPRKEKGHYLIAYLTIIQSVVRRSLLACK